MPGAGDRAPLARYEKGGFIRYVLRMFRKKRNVAIFIASALLAPGFLRYALLAPIVADCGADIEVKAITLDDKTGAAVAGARYHFLDIGIDYPRGGRTINFPISESGADGELNGAFGLFYGCSQDWKSLLFLDGSNGKFDIIVTHKDYLEYRRDLNLFKLPYDKQTRLSMADLGEVRLIHK